MKRVILSFLFFCLFISGADAASRFAVCSTTCTWDNTSTAMWAASSGGATGQSAPTVADTVTLDASTCTGGTTCTITVNANISVFSLTMGACTATTAGCILDFSANNNNITFGNVTNALSITGTGTRTLKMGSGNWTFSQTAGTMINAITSTNLTLVPGTSTIVTNHTNGGGTTVTFQAGTGLTWAKLTINGNINIGNLNILGTPTFTAVIINGPNYVDYNGGGTNTITSLAVFGTSTNLVSINFPQWQMVSGAVTANWTWIRGAVCAGGATFAFANSFDGGGGSTGCHVTPPSASGSSCILGGWLLWRDMPGHINDNFPAWLEKVA